MKRMSLVAAAAWILGCTAPTSGTRPVAPPVTPAVQNDPTPSPGAPAVGAVDHVGMTVTDLEASKALFVDVLGFAVRGKDDSYPAYFLSNGAATVTLWRAEDPAAAIAFDRRRNVGLHHLALSVASFDQLDALHQALMTHPGVTIEFAPELAYGGPSKHMMFREPSGNRIELVHRPG